MNGYLTRYNQEAEPVRPYEIELGPLGSIDLTKFVHQAISDADRLVDRELDKVDSLVDRTIVKLNPVIQGAQRRLNRTLLWAIPALVLGGGLVTYVAVRAARR